MKKWKTEQYTRCLDWKGKEETNPEEDWNEEGEVKNKPRVMTV
jgi:hypothetical protein